MLSKSATASVWKHSHVFDLGNPLGERSTRRVAMLTAAMMIIEIVGGLRFHSMALIADGWHMSSHVIALGLSALGYAFARRFAASPHFAFGTWKIEVLGGYTSAVLLIVIALTMCYGSVQRVIVPAEIHYDEAIAIACLGLAVNLICAWWLRGSHHHEHDDYAHAAHGHPHDHHQDLNLRSAYVHVAADAATSLLAILALTAGKIWNAPWWDPVIGIVGSVVVAVWAYRLIRDTARVLLDAEMTAPVVEEIREVIRHAAISAEICDLHVWRVGKGKYSCVLSLATAHALSADQVRQWLSVHEELVHVTVEINHIHMPVPVSLAAE